MKQQPTIRDPKHLEVLRDKLSKIVKKRYLPTPMGWLKSLINYCAEGQGRFLNRLPHLGQ